MVDLTADLQAVLIARRHGPWRPEVAAHEKGGCRRDIAAKIQQRRFEIVRARNHLAQLVVGGAGGAGPKERTGSEGTGRGCALQKKFRPGEHSRASSLRPLSTPFLIEVMPHAAPFAHSNTLELYA